MRLGQLRNLLSVIAIGMAVVAINAAADVFEHPVAGNPDKLDALNRLSEDLAAQSKVDGEFVQEKYLTVLEKPLRSHGSFSFSTDGEFVWRVKEPFTVTYSFSDNKLYKQDSDEQTRIKPSDDPMLFGFFSFFSTVFDMSQAELTKTFHVYFQQQGNQWVLGLEPKADLLKDAVENIVVQGEMNQGQPDTGQTMPVAISKVTIREPGGDYSHLLFNY